MENMLGVMLDCSRNAVMKPETIKKYADILKKMGYNTLMIYTEDTYEIENQPYFGHLRGRFSKEELKDIDKYCNSIGIELIPCIQTLAHLDNMFKWSSVYGCINDCDNILLVGDEKTYKLIEDMIATCSECFTTRKIHIGMDEAYRVGTGVYQTRNGIEDRFDIINKHLHRVCEITEKYGLETMLWSDMFVRLALNIGNQFDEAETSKILEKAKLPENVSLVYWDYFSTDYSHYMKQINTHRLFDRNIYFAGGMWSWRGFAPDNTFAMETTKAAINACRDNPVNGMIFTVWGDDGGECSHFSVLPSLMFAAELVKGNEDMESIKAKFKEITGCEFDSFMLLDKFDKIGGKHTYNPCKYLLYNDLFMGIRDFACDKEDGMYYAQLAEELNRVDADSEYCELFTSYTKLADVLSVKATLGIETREAYLLKDIAKIGKIIKQYDSCIEKLREFHKAYQKLWFKYNKPHGFDVQDIRIGGIIQRALSCRERLSDFAEGKINCIYELEEPMLNEQNGMGYWWRIVTANNIYYHP